MAAAAIIIPALKAMRTARRSTASSEPRACSISVVDFDAAVRDPARPDRMLARYDSADGLHPSEAGYRAMGDAVPPRFLGVGQAVRRRRRRHGPIRVGPRWRSRSMTYPPTARCRRVSRAGNHRCNCLGAGSRTRSASLWLRQWRERRRRRESDCGARSMARGGVPARQS